MQPKERGLAEAREGMEREGAQGSVGNQPWRQFSRQAVGQEELEWRQRQEAEAGTGVKRLHRLVQAGAGLEHRVVGRGTHIARQPLAREELLPPELAGKAFVEAGKRKIFFPDTPIFLHDG